MTDTPTPWTPGPWEIQNERLDDPWNADTWITADEARMMVADRIRPEDARLIAAAPEMAELLARMVDDSPEDWEEFVERLKPIEALLARISGSEEGE